MRILFAYFDFSVPDEKNPAPRMIGECKLNFSTTHNYFVKRESVGTEADQTYKYCVTRSEKPEDEMIPKGFWGDGIYNMTAIVGNNGYGKSTILHSVIKGLVKGLEPGVPFLLVLQATDSEEIIPYCSGDDWSGPEDFRFRRDYPEALGKAKIMLLDNTLTRSAIELDRLYDGVCPADGPAADEDVMPEPVPEYQKQFYNKSLIASVRYSNALSMAGDRKRYLPVADALETHLNYESLQETRFLFDRFHQETLDSLKNEGCPVPKPRHLLVSVAPPEQLQRILAKESIQSGIDQLEGWKTLQNTGFFSIIIADALLNLCLSSIGAEEHQFFVTIYYDFFYRLKNARDVVSLADNIRLLLSASEKTCRSEGLRRQVENCRRFIEFVIRNRKHLLEIFELFSPPNLEGRLYRIDVERTRSDAEMRACMITFLDRYRPVHDQYYFMVFHSGMSSGEKNLLRMLTQFRYAFNGPPVYPEDATENNTSNSLQNVFEAEEPVDCDTLFLFLDEADLTYHPEWQRVFVFILTSILPRVFRVRYNQDCGDPAGCRDIQVFLATHSPLMLGDFPKAGVEYLDPVEKRNEYADRDSRQSSFGENLYSILKDKFFMTSATGEFAKHKINAAAKWCKEVRELPKDSRKYSEENQNAFNEHYATARMLARGIIRSKLTEELEDCAKILKITIPGKESLEAVRRQRDELQSELDRAYEKLREAGLMDEQDT